MRRILLMFLAMIFLLMGCSQAQTAASDYAPDESKRLVVYTSHKEEVYWPIIKEFEERTGIWVEVVTGGTNELLEKIDGEKSSPVADVMFGGGVESLESYSDCFVPYASPELQYIDEQFRDEENLWTPFSALPVVLIYNTKLMHPEQLTSWSDLLKPEFNGKIAFADPSVSGSSFTALVTMLYAVGGDVDSAIQSFADCLEGAQLSGSGDVTVSVADGTNLAGVTLEETAMKRIAAGDDIAMVYPSDGTSCVPDASALVKGAPHEDNAKLFLDFTVSQDVQELLGSKYYRRPVREDVEPELVLTELADIQMVDYNIGWASSNRDSILMTWAFYLEEELS